MKTTARITSISQYTGVTLTKNCKLTKANKRYKCSVKDCVNEIRPGDLHWSDQTYRICINDRLSERR